MKAGIVGSGKESGAASQLLQSPIIKRQTAPLFYKGDKMDELEKTPPLTNDELTDIICAVDHKVNILHDSILQLIQTIVEQLNFQDEQILITQLDSYKFENKTPKKKLAELENSFHGLVNYVNTTLSNRISLLEQSRESIGIKDKYIIKE